MGLDAVGGELTVVYNVLGRSSDRYECRQLHDKRVFECGERGGQFCVHLRTPFNVLLPLPVLALLVSKG